MKVVLSKRCCKIFLDIVAAKEPGVGIGEFHINEEKNITQLQMNKFPIITVTELRMIV